MFIRLPPFPSRITLSIKRLSPEIARKAETEHVRTTAREGMTVPFSKNYDDTVLLFECFVNLVNLKLHKVLKSITEPGNVVEQLLMTEKSQVKKALGRGRGW